MLVPQHFKRRNCPTAWLPHGIQLKNIGLKSLEVSALLVTRITVPLKCKLPLSRATQIASRATGIASHATGIASRATGIV